MIKDFNYLLNIDQKEFLASDKFAVRCVNSSDQFNSFEKISWDDTNISSLFKFGKIFYNNEYKIIDYQTSNKNVLESISVSYNEQINNTEEAKSGMEKLIKHDNIYNVIGTLITEPKVVNNIALSLSQIYNGKYSSYIYRAKRAYSQNVDSHIVKFDFSNSNKHMPIFSFDTTRPLSNLDFSVYFIYRNIPVPFKVVQTSEHNGVWSYIAIYNETLITTFKEFIDSVMYIEFNQDVSLKDDKIYYDYLIDDGNNKLLYPNVEKFLTKTEKYSENIDDYKIANLQSNRTFFKK